MDKKKDDEILNNQILDRLKDFIIGEYGSMTKCAEALGVRTSTVTTMFRRKSLPSGAMLLRLKQLKPNLDLNVLFGDNIKIGLEKDENVEDVLKLLAKGFTISVDLRH